MKLYEIEERYRAFADKMEAQEGELTEQDFQQTINDYLAYLIKEGRIYES